MGKNILICNDSLGIGGVETVIYNQVATLQSKGYNVYVLANNGIYVDKIKALGAKYIEFKFPEENEFNIQRINKIVDIIKENDITEIHIHKYQCVLTVMPAALITNIPYVAYIHERKSSLGYYTWNYPVYNTAFDIYFKNAYKIVVITKSAIKFTKELYNIEDSKYIIEKNGLNFEIYKNENPNYNKKINYFAIVSRLSEDKILSIKNGIDLFYKYAMSDKENTNIRLDIIGDGSCRKKIEEYIEEKREIKERIKLIGARNDLEKCIQYYDVLLGMGRCIIEALAMKIPTILLGYEGIKGVINHKNFELALEENLSGDNLEQISIEECIKQIEYLKENKQENIEKMYEIAREKLDYNKNFYLVGDNEVKYEFNWIELFKLIQKNTEENTRLKKDVEAKQNYINEVDKKIQSKENIERSIKEEKEALRREINDIYNSKRWRCFEKISKIFHKK